MIVENKEANMVAKKEKKTYLAKVISVKYVKVSPYIYKKLKGLDDRRYNGYKSKWIDEVIENPEIKHQEDSLCYAHECASGVYDVPYYRENDAEYVVQHKKEQKEQYDMVISSGYYDCSCFTN